jgi:hypothetical protein
MKVLTIKSEESLQEKVQTDVHYILGMEHYTDYIFTARGARQYSATIVLEDTAPVIEKIVTATQKLEGMLFIIEDLDMEKNTIERLHVREGKVRERLRSGWKWD